MFLKQEKPEMNDFERKKNFSFSGHNAFEKKYYGLEGKIALRKNFIWEKNTFLEERMQVFFTCSLSGRNNKKSFVCVSSHT